PARAAGRDTGRSARNRVTRSARAVSGSRCPSGRASYAQRDGEAEVATAAPACDDVAPGPARARDRRPDLEAATRVHPGENGWNAGELVPAYERPREQKGVASGRAALGGAAQPNG